MAKRTLTVVLAGDNKKFRSAMSDSEKAFNRFGKTLALGAAAGGAALAALGAKGVLNANKLEKGLAEVRTLLPQLSDDGFGKLEKQVLQFSDSMGIATDKVVPALYQAISAGVPPDNVIDFLRVSGQAAVGGVTDLETAVDGISSIVNAYGKEALSAGEASDLLFTAVRLGKTDFTQLSNSLFNVAPFAAQAGVEFGEVTAALAAMTAQGTPTSVATTQLRAAIQSLVAPTKISKGIMDDLGLSFDATTLAEKGLAAAFDEMYQATGGNLEQMRKLVGSVEGMQAILQLAGPNADNFAGIVAEMGLSAGATDAAFGTVSDTMDFKWSVATNKINNMLTRLGQKIMPYVNDAIDKLLPLLEEWWRRFELQILPALQVAGRYLVDTFAPVLRDLIATFNTHFLPVLRELGAVIANVVKWVFDWLQRNQELVQSVGIAIAIVGSIVGVVYAVSTAIAVLSGAMAFLAANPIVLVIAAAVGLVAILVHLYRNSETFRNFIDNKLIPSLKWLHNIFNEVFKAVAGVVQWAWRVIGETLFGAPTLPTKVANVWGRITGKVRDIFEAVVGFVQSHWAKILAILFPAVGLPILIGRNWGKIVDVAAGILKKLVEWFGWMWDSVKGVLNGVIGGWEGMVNSVIRGINRMVSALNGLSFSIPSWVPGLGGKSFGLSLPTVPTISLPRLAEGGIVTQPTTAIVGEAGPEAVIPLDRAGGMMGTNITYNIYIDAPGGDPEAIGDAIFPALQALERKGAVVKVTQ